MKHQHAKRTPGTQFRAPAIRIKRCRRLCQSTQVNNRFKLAVRMISQHKPIQRCKHFNLITLHSQPPQKILTQTESIHHSPVQRLFRQGPYEGLDPHGMMLETFYTEATIGDHTGTLIVKRNYGPEGVEVTQVLMDPGKHLGAYTVMFKREAGYDADNADWFWAKYLADGSLDKNPKGMQLAGRVAKGADAGCIACHSNADGDDYVFTSDHIN